jgi:hypothetical protein
MKLFQSDEFYIGYLPQAPEKTAKAIRIMVVALGLIVIAVCSLLVANQRKFSSGVFEYGELTIMEGVLSRDPVPNLRIKKGNESSMVLLVGFGKMGAEQIINTLEDQGNKLMNQYVHLNGTKIYDHGKQLFQITLEDNIDTRGEPTPENFPPRHTEPIGSVLLTGEIVDPKCYFGVMKPAEGKPHRSCAIRCIAGGIAPVFVVRDSEFDFVILDGEKINDEILPLIGDPLQLRGDLLKINDWVVMKVDMDNLKMLAERRTKENLLTLDQDLTVCISSSE